MNNKVRVEPQYRRIEIIPKSLEENMDIYSDENFYQHFFKTKEGKMALGQMPDWVFRPKSKKNKRQQDADLIS